MSDVNPHHTLSETEQEHIAGQLAKNGHTITDYKIKSTAVNGNLGEYFRVELTIKEKDSEKKYNLFMKSLPSECWKTEFLVNEGVFLKEVNFYRDLSGLLRKYLSTDMSPPCFLADPGKIVLADASTDGYRPWRGITKEPLDYEHTKLGLEALARLHVGSIIYEEKTGRKVGADFPDAAREVNYRPNSLGLDFLATGARAVAALPPHLDTALGKDPVAVALLQEHLESWVVRLEHYVNEESPHRQVICHGDTWPANFLYKYDQRQKPISALLIDFQLTRLRSPAFDVNMFLYLSTLTDDLKNWRESLLDAYYHVMAEEMRLCGLDADKVYPKQDFLQACIYYQIVGLIFSMMYFPFSMVPLEVKDEAASTDDKAQDFYFKDRSKHLIQWYKEYPMLRNSLDGVMDIMYHNFIKTKRGLTEFVS